MAGGQSSFHQYFGFLVVVEDFDQYWWWELDFGDPWSVVDQYESESVLRGVAEGIFQLHEKRLPQSVVGKRRRSQ